ncbi:MAG: IclR family transcriptional regulator [Pseudomonadota bacterium]
MTETKNKRNSPKRILEIMEAICQNPEAATASRLSEVLEIPLPTVYRWLDTLDEERFITPTGTGHYIPGQRLRDLVLQTLKYEPNVTERRSILRSLSVKINETVSLSVPQGTKLIYFDRLESNWPMQVNLAIGAELPLHCCASGKLYLSTFARKSANRVFELMSTQPSARNTITSKTAFTRELNTIRERGYALDNEEWFDDMVGAAVPVLDRDGHLIACLSTHVLKTRKSIVALEADVHLLKATATELATCLSK